MFLSTSVTSESLLHISFGLNGSHYDICFSVYLSFLLSLSLSLSLCIFVSRSFSHTYNRVVGLHSTNELGGQRENRDDAISYPIWS